MVGFRHHHGAETLHVRLVVLEIHLQLVHPLQIEGHAALRAVDLEGVLVLAPRREARDLEGTYSSTLETYQKRCGVVYRHLVALHPSGRRELITRLLQRALLNECLRHPYDLRYQSDEEASQMD